MFLLLHGAAGGWDELIIAVAAFGVLWIAVKLAGRKSAGEQDGEVSEEAVSEQREEATDVAEDRQGPAKPPAAKTG